MGMGKWHGGTRWLQHSGLFLFVASLITGIADGSHCLLNYSLYWDLIAMQKNYLEQTLWWV